MKVAKSKANGIRQLWEVCFESQEVESARGKVAEEVNRLARIPGFRPGKAPIGMLEKRYGGDIVHRLLRKLREEALRAVLEHDGLEVFAFESIDHLPYHRGQDLTFQVSLDVTPEVNLPDYDTIPLPPEDTAVSEAEIDEVVSMLLNHRAQFKPVDRPIRKGDSVKLNFVGYLEDGQPLLEKFPTLKIWADQKGTLEEAGGQADHGIREIIDGIIGLEVGGKKTIEVTFAPDFHVSDLAGLHVSYEVEIVAIHEKNLPAMDENFFRHFGAESETQLRARIHEYIRQGKARDSALRRRKAIGDFLESHIDLPLPESAVRSETERIFDHLLQENLTRGPSKEAAEQNRAAIRANAEKMAREKVKMTIIIDHIAKKENLQLEDRELSQLILEGAQAHGVRPQQVVEILKKDSRALDDLRKRGLAIKTIDFILQKIVQREAMAKTAAPVKSSEDPAMKPVRGRRRASAKDGDSDGRAENAPAVEKAKKPAARKQPSSRPKKAKAEDGPVEKKAKKTVKRSKKEE